MSHETTPAIERAAARFTAHGVPASTATAAAIDALGAALSGRVLGADEMHTEAAAALFGGPDVKTPHMPQREGETYMDWCDRVAAVAVDAIKAALLGTDTPEPCLEDQIESGEFTGKPQYRELLAAKVQHDRHGCGDPSCDC